MIIDLLLALGCVAMMGLATMLWGRRPSTERLVAALVAGIVGSVVLIMIVGAVATPSVLPSSIAMVAAGGGLALVGRRRMEASAHG